ncbi:fimbria/pilus periplasmic chaperone [Providencia rettgeri]|uniref:fimbria/pilus periplasmic chaperone n=1 Tax=Providencia rettgeri TaxID=587 RepID=UPI001BA7CCD5|nr:fimbria/pilus periplasmic chaperone [Providencia rettgeri]ELR5100306.1 fimbria/pilus periplasmic chaperone [Providencia rettgeri]ELT5688321.1 fimbria/pilus periplasmic chaperone [Providencia rettgeri]MBS0861617.1 fimbria/pilus periplasmic chaperone [Providencia rettgeri]MBS0875532.1 fimbria/pilus periplasmic chaperone [Providencia rettgeri]MBS0918416.1 fimbria/pilus periplasmic chaperone [Providencia rettgeri]
MQLKIASGVVSSLIGLTMLSSTANGAVSMDRTRVIFEGNQKSISLNISNNNKQLPYLAQGWIENTEGQKIQSPLVVLPPVQRLEPGKSSQVKIEALSAINTLPQDRESLFYFNLREIPPKSEKPNTLQIALQTRVKLFYRPKSIIPEKNGTPWQEKLTLEKQGDMYVVKNPTPYYVTIINATANTNSTNAKEFIPLMVPPFGQDNLGEKASLLGSSPVLTYINDFGGRPTLAFRCQSATCNVVPSNKSE